ncbi:MAG TPA: universal stress protein [Candidatus Binataceae bacterium]|nr:universal stress protein [Candidatus Binataceae bacterium]
MIQNVKKVMAPLDFSEHSAEALRNAWELTRDVNGDLHIVHVVGPHFTIVERTRELMRENAMQEQAEEELARLKKDELGNSDKVTTAVLVGPPVGKLVEYAKENGIDLIVLPAFGHSGAEYALIGGVTEKLVRQAPCSVLVLKPRQR